MGETMRAIRVRTTVLISSALVAGLILSGCGADDSSDQANTAGGSAVDAQSAKEGGAEGNPAPGAAAPEGQDSAAKAPNLSVDQRSIIYRGAISVRVKDVNAAAGQTTGIATTAGGFVGADNRSSGGSGTDTATLELRIPAPKFGSVVDQLSKLGTEEQRQINTEDVTEETVDLDARITVQQARVDSGRKLLAQAKSLNELVMLEREVATRESDLASLQAKKRRLADLTALSTISVTFLDPRAEVTPDDDGSPGFLSGLDSGWTALVASLGVLLTVLGALLPWLIAFGLPFWGILYAYRRYKKRATGQPALATAGPAPSREADEDED
jgi:hypothetical protein